MIKEIAEFIEDLTPYTIGTQLFAGFWNSEAPDLASVVREISTSELFFFLPDRKNAMIQVVTRGEDYHDSRDMAYVIYNALHTRSARDLPMVTSGENYVAMVIEAVTTPQYILEDEKGRHIFSTNFIFRLRDA